MRPRFARPTATFLLPVLTAALVNWVLTPLPIHAFGILIIAVGVGCLLIKAGASDYDRFLDANADSSVPPDPVRFIATRSVAFLSIPVSMKAADLLSARLEIFVPTWSALIAGGIAYGVGRALSAIPETRKRAVFHRGRPLITFEKAQQIAKQNLPPNDPGVHFGGIRLPSRVATTHFCVVGATGSGKTTAIRLLMESALPRIETGSDHRALIYDPKNDVLGQLRSMGLRCPVHILNPFHMRSVAWNMARDIRTPTAALQLADILIPKKDQETQPFFPDASRDLLSGVVLAFIDTAPDVWTFRDVLLSFKTEERIALVLNRSAETRALVDQYLKSREFHSIHTTIGTRLAPYRPIAALWNHAEELISLRDWCQSDSILVLGNHETSRVALDAVNRLLFRRLSELILHQTESTTRRTWAFIDEAREAGKLEGLSSLLTQGRSKGAAVVLGFQDIDGLRDAYQERVANEITAQCANKMILRLESDTTALWASHLIGEAEAYEYTENKSSGPGGPTTTVNEQLVKRERVLASEIMTLPPPSPTQPPSAYCLIRTIGAYKAVLPHVTFNDRPPKGGEPPDYQFRPREQEYLRDWDNADRKRLGLPPDDTARPPKATLSDDSGTSLDDIPRISRDD